MENLVRETISIFSVIVELPNGEQETRTIKMYISNKRVSCSEIETAGKIVGVVPIHKELQSANQKLN